MKAFGFFRSHSHDYPSVQVTCSMQSDNLITLIFNGMKERAQVAVHFTLEKLSAIVTTKDESILKGFITIDDEKAEYVVKATFADASGSKLKAIGNEVGGREFKMQQ